MRSRNTSESNHWATPLIVALGMLVVATWVLYSEGRRWWCSCGDPSLWMSDAWGSHTSQHLLDPYSFTHFSHGLALWGLLWFSSDRLSLLWRAVAALSLEGLWEVVENSSWVIDRYRDATAAVGYTGDTIFNAHGDIASCGLGLFVAHRLGWRRSLAIFILIEIILLVWIRDSLVLNVIMLLCPIDAIRSWQVRH